MAPGDQNLARSVGRAHGVGKAFQDADRPGVASGQRRGDPVKEQLLGPLDHWAGKSREAQTGQEGRKLPRRGHRDRAHSSLSSLGARRGMCGAQPRLYTMIVRLKVMTTCPSWLYPVVFTVTMPTFGRDCDSRLASTSDWE